MSGPRVSLPASWHTTRLDRVATVRARIGWKALTADEYVPEGYAFLATPNIKTDVIDFQNVNFITEYRYEESPELKLRVGDVLLVKDGNTLGITNLVRELPRPATVNGSIAVVRATAMTPAFLRYVLASDYVQGRIGAYRAGMGVPHLFQADIKKFPLPQPPAALQEAIVDYLDDETARLDEIETAYRRQLGLLALRKRAGVSDALRSHSTGDVAVRRLVSTVTSGPRGWSSLEVEGFGLPFLRIANVPADSITLNIDEVAFVDPPKGDESDRCRVRPGDVLTTITAAIGQVAVVPADLGEAYVSQHLALLRPDRALVMPEWLALAFWTEDAQRQLDAARYGGTKQQLSLDDIREVIVPLAEMTVQRTVVSRVLASLEAATQAEQQIRRLIDLLLERRHALITAAVTGQLEIPGAAA